MDIESMTLPEIRNALKKREEEEEAKAYPCPLETPNFGFLKKTCEAYIRRVADKSRNSNDLDDEQYQVFESAITCLYGQDVWGWVNKRL